MTGLFRDTGRLLKLFLFSLELCFRSLALLEGEICELSTAITEATKFCAKTACYSELIRDSYSLVYSLGERSPVHDADSTMLRRGYGVSWGISACYCAYLGLIRPQYNLANVMRMYFRDFHPAT